MNYNFTLRDFLVYFSTGALLIICIDIIFFNEILIIISRFLEKYIFIKEFTGLLILLVIPFIYLIGNILHSIDFLFLKIYKGIHSLFNKLKISRYILFKVVKWIFHFFLYRNKVINSIIKENKRNKTWQNPEKFWENCAKLQIKGCFDSANYWHTLNDLFKGLYISFLISFILSLRENNIILAILFATLMLVCLFRAIQFADSFVSTVKRLNNSYQTLNKYKK